MSRFLRGLVLTAAGAGLIVATFTPLTADAASRTSPRHRPVRTAPTTADFKTDQMEYYLGDDGIAYVRPGLKVKVNSITIGSDRKPVVDLNITDNFDQPLDRAGKTTPGAVSLSMIMAVYNPDTRQFTAYTTRSATGAAGTPGAGVTVSQAGTDSGGTWTDLETGHAKYTFKTALPANYDPSKTHTLGIYGSRNLTDIVGKSYYANVEKDFRPDGVAVTDKWDKITDATTCNNCHDPLAAHGGSRQDLKLCVLCHSDQTVDPDSGNSVSMALMAHKIHRGAGLANGYVIIGHGGSVVDFSDVEFPQDIRNCQNCHVGSGTSKGSQWDVYLTKPSRQACGACHDTINWVTGENHMAGPQANDVACATCHIPDSGDEFDASIKGAHTIPLKSKQLKGLKVSIVNVTNVAPGSKPTITMKVTNGDGSAVDGSKLNTFSPISAGPTSSYRNYYRETGAGKATFDAATGNTTYTFTNAIPADAKGTWAFSADVYRRVNIKRADSPTTTIEVRESAKNPQLYVALAPNTTVVPRRVTVDMNLCNNCHDSLALHGGQRMTIDECVICHNPTMSDVSQRVADAGDPESISFQRMIHRIHTGEELTQDFTVYGNNHSVNNYNEVVFPGDRKNCASCHINSGQQLPPAKGADPVVTLRDYFSPQGPGTAACLGCHDNQDAAAHAFLNTTNFGGTATAEACATCHGPNKDWAVDKVHAR